MLKTAITATAFLLLGAGMASADVIDFEGTIKFTKKNAFCDSGVRLNVVRESQYHPGNTIAPANNDWTGLNMVDEYSAMAWGGTSPDFSTTYQKVSYGVLGLKFAGTTSDQDLSASKTYVKLLAVPSGVTTATKSLTLRGRIKNPFAKGTQTKCEVDFSATYINRKYAPPAP
jgi:hypothetical protein